MKNWIFAILLISPPALGKWGMEVHLYTQHFIDMGPIEKNEKNYGLGISYRFSENWKALAGFYRNSLTTHEYKCSGQSCSWEPENLDSHYVSFERSIISDSYYEFGIGFGVADGYEKFVNERGITYKKGEDYNLLAGPYLNLGEKYSIKLRYMFELASLGMQYSF